MSWLKKNLIFTTLMVLLAGVLAFEIFLVLGKRASAREAEAALKTMVGEYQRLVTQDVLPHQRNVELTRAEIQRQREELEIYVQEMAASEELTQRFTRHPTSRADAVFDIQFFVDEFRERARAIGLEGLGEDYFGFGAYAQTGPEEALLPTVYKQRLIVAHILERLFEARPHSVISVQRPGEGRGGEQDQQAAPRGGARGGQPAAGGAGFRLNPQLTAAIPNVAEAAAYEVTFTGRASTLRTFLNEIASYEMPLIVRSVQVSPAGDAVGRRDQQEAPARRRGRVITEGEGSPTQEGEPTESEPREENIPLVADNLSRFTVAMEYIDVIPLDNAR